MFVLGSAVAPASPSTTVVVMGPRVALRLPGTTWMDAIFKQLSRYDLAIPRRDAPEFCCHIPPSPIRGRRECRAPDAPDSRVCNDSERRTRVNQVTPEIARHSPRNGFNGFLRALVSAKSARMCERAALTSRPSLDLSPFVLKGRKSLTGSVGQTRCLPQPEQLHGLRARTEQGRELDDGTKWFGCRRY